MKTHLKRLMKQPTKRKGTITLFLIALGVFIIGGIIAINPLVRTPDADNIILPTKSTESLTIDNMDETTSSELNIQDKTLTAEEDMPFSIESIGANEVVCVGKIELKEGLIYKISASVESGEKIFVALNESDNVSSYKGIEWKQFTGVTETQIEAQFTDLQTGTFYVYVGNSAQEPLIGVSGILHAK